MKIPGRFINSDWKQAFAPVQRRILLRHMFQYLSFGILSALAGILILYGVSFLFPFETLLYACLIIGLLTIVFVLVIGWLKRPSAYEAARMVDKFGLKEKVLTACELDDRDDTMAQLQRKDAIDSLSAFDKRQISLRVPKPHIFALILMTMALVLVNLIPNPMNRLIQERQLLREEIEEQLHELKKTEEELAEQGGLTQEQKQELAKLVEELAEQLKQTEDYKEALKEISRTEEELAALTDKIREESIGQLAGQLGSLEEASALAKALSDRNLADLEAELEKLKEQLEQGVDKEELADKLKETLEKAAQTMADGEIKEKLAAAASSLQDGQTSTAAEQLGEAMKQAINASNAMGDARYALQQMRSSIAQAAGESQYAQNSGGRSDQNSNERNQGNNNQDSEGQGSEEGQGQGSGQGQGTGQGQAAGQGQGNSGQSGSGVGTGTTNNSSDQSGSGTTDNQNGNSQMGDENAQTVYERIYAPERLGDGGEITHVPGQQTGEGEVTIEDDGRGIGDFTGYIPYRDVYQEYRNEAMNSMERRVLPPNIQELVRQYFDALGN